MTIYEARQLTLQGWKQKVLNDGLDAMKDELDELKHKIEARQQDLDDFEHEVRAVERELDNLESEQSDLQEKIESWDNSEFEGMPEWVQFELKREGIL